MPERLYPELRYPELRYGDTEDSSRAAAAVLAAARYAVVLTGAGLSVESGIPPFRGAGGLWTGHGPPASLSYREFLRSPGEWWEGRLRDEVTPGNPTYELKGAVDRAAPNPGHLAIAALEREGIVKAVITQNVDGLHGRAGSRQLLEIHGNRSRLRCIGCGRRWPRAGYALGDLPPLCRDCGGVIKPDSVMFGEPIPSAVREACFAAARRCDAMLVVGASGTVNPAAQLPLLARERGAPVIEVNPEPTVLTAAAAVVVRGPAGEVLPRIAAAAARVRRAG